MSTWDVKAGRVIYISYISHFVVRVQLADLNWWVVFNLSSCGLYLPLSATQSLSQRILTNKNRKRHILCAYMNTSHGCGFATRWRYRDRSSPAQLPGVPYPWLSSTWRVPKVGHTSRYDIKSWQPFCYAGICKDNLVTSMTWFVWRKIVECTT